MDLQGTMCAALPSDDPCVFLIANLDICTYYTNRIDENDKKNFDRILKLHPHFPALILAFNEDPDAYDNFVTMVSFRY